MSIITSHAVHIHLEVYQTIFLYKYYKNIIYITQTDSLGDNVFIQITTFDSWSMSSRRKSTASSGGR